MKKLFNKMITSMKNFFKWVWSECKDWHTIALLAFVCLFIGLPVWGGYLLYFIFHWGWAFWVASISWGFWMLPGAPFFALSVSVTLIIKKLYERFINKNSNTSDHADSPHGDAEKKDTDNNDKNNE